MDINTRTLRYALLGSSKREQRIKLGLYFKYRSNSYLSNYYPAPMPKYNLQTANTNDRLLYRSSSYRPQSLSSSSPISSKYYL
jgi:hypothetical protein